MTQASRQEGGSNGQRKRSHPRPPNAKNKAIHGAKKTAMSPPSPPNPGRLSLTAAAGVGKEGCRRSGLQGVAEGEKCPPARRYVLLLLLLGERQGKKQKRVGKVRCLRKQAPEGNEANFIWGLERGHQRERGKEKGNLEPLPSLALLCYVDHHRYHRSSNLGIAFRRVPQRGVLPPLLQYSVVETLRLHGHR